MLNWHCFLFKAALNRALQVVSTKLNGLDTDAKRKKRGKIEFQIDEKRIIDSTIIGDTTLSYDIKEKELLKKLGDIIDHPNPTTQPTLSVKRYNPSTTNCDEIGHLLRINAFNEYNEISNGEVSINPLNWYDEVPLYAHCGVDMLHCLLNILTSIQ